MKYIDAEKLIAEIKKRIKFHDDAMKACTGINTIVITHSAGWKEDTKLLDIIDSLQQEQPDLPGIEEAGIPGKDYIPVEWVDACEEYGKWEIVKKEQSEGIEGVVHHYANVHYIFTNKEQLNARLKDFEEGAEVRIFINARKED